MNPELVIKSKPIDFEICELLGTGSADFVVLCFDGVQLDFFGTPYDSPASRERYANISERLNDHSEASLWPLFFVEWLGEIRRQFKLKDETTAEEFRPAVSCKISRVCHGYSEHLHSAIGLFETLSDKIQSWKIVRAIDCSVEIFTKDGSLYAHRGDVASQVIAEAILKLLKATAVKQSA